MPSKANVRPGQRLVFWVLWATLTTSIVIYQFNLGGGFAHDLYDHPFGFYFPLPLVVGTIFVATVIRWFVLPRMATVWSLLSAFIVGMALSETAGFYGIFLIGQGGAQIKMTSFYLALLSAIQFAPIYAKGGD